MARKNLGYILCEANLIDEVQMRIALEEQKRTGKKFGSTLVDLKFLDENVLAAFLSHQLDIPCISLLNVEIPAKVMKRIPAVLALRYQAVPIRQDENGLHVAMMDPTDFDAVAALEEAAGCRVNPLIAPQSSILKMLEKVHGVSDEAGGVEKPLFPDLIEEIDAEDDIPDRLARIEADLAQVKLLLARILERLLVR